MTKHISVEVKKRSIACKEEECFNQFRMAFPDQVVLVLSEALILRLKLIAEFMKANKINSMQTLNSYRKNPDPSYAKFYKDGKEMEISTYIDCDKQYHTVELDCFNITCDSVHSYEFTASFLYVNETCAELVIKTLPFSLED